MPQVHEQNAMARRREKVALNGLVRLVRFHKRTPDELFRVVRDIYYRRLPSWLGPVHTALLRYMEHEDIVQECLCKAWERFNQFDPDKSAFRVWLRVIAQAHATDLYRHYKADKRTAYVRPLFDDDHKPDDTPLDHLLRQEAAQVLQETVRILKDAVGDPLLYDLRFENRMSCREIAQIMKVPKSTVNARLNKALERAWETWTAYIRAGHEKSL